MKSEVMSDETLNAVCGIFERPKDQPTSLEWSALCDLAWRKQAESDARLWARWQLDKCGHSNPPKSVHWEAT